MAHQTLLVGLVLVPALLLTVLVWWRFYGKGREALRSGTDLRQYLSIRNHYYDVSDYISPLPPAEPSEWGGTQNILAELLEDRDKGPDCRMGQPTGEEQLFPGTGDGGNPPGSPDQREPQTGTDPETSPYPETPASPPDAAQGSPETPEEGEDAIAPSLFYNAVTAPADTENDTRNRQAVAAHRARKGAALRAKLTNQKEALGELFLGNPTAAKPEDQAP